MPIAPVQLRPTSILAGITGLAVLAGALWTFDGKTTRLYCKRCSALRETTDVEVFGICVPGRDRIRKTQLSRWIESHRYPDCTHHWGAGYSDGLWYRSCHRGNIAEKLETWGNDAVLLQAIDRRQGEDPGFVDRLVDSLGDYDAESHNFLVSVWSDEIERRSSEIVLIPTSP